MEEPKNFIEQYSITYPDMFAEYMGLTKEQLVGLLINLRLQIEYEMEDKKGCDNCSNCIKMQQLSENSDEKIDQEKQGYIEFGTYDPEGFSYDVIYKPGCSVDDFKTEVLNICKNFSKEERNEMTDTGDIIDKVTIKLEENGWIVLETKSAMVEDVIIFNKDTKGHYSYKQNCEFFGKEFIDAVIDKK